MCKTRKPLTSLESYYKEKYSKFKCEHDLDHHTRRFIYTFRIENKGKSNLKTFIMFMNEFSFKVPGVSWLSSPKAISEWFEKKKKIKVSPRTISRYLEILKEYGFIDRFQDENNNTVTVFNRMENLKELPGNEQPKPCNCHTPGQENDIPNCHTQKEDSNPSETRDEGQKNPGILREYQDFNTKKNTLNKEISIKEKFYNDIVESSIIPTEYKVQLKNPRLIDKMIFLNFTISKIESHYSSVKHIHDDVEYFDVLLEFINKGKFAPDRFHGAMNNWLQRNRRLMKQHEEEIESIENDSDQEFEEDLFSHPIFKPSHLDSAYRDIEQTMQMKSIPFVALKGSELLDEIKMMFSVKEIGELSNIVYIVKEKNKMILSPTEYRELDRLFENIYKLYEDENHKFLFGESGSTFEELPF